MPFTSEELEVLRSRLPKGAASELAARFGFKPGSVRNILSGLSNNDEVILAAFEMAQKYQAKVSATKSALSE